MRRNKERMNMFDSTSTANRISEWTHIVPSMPKAVLDAIAAYDEAAYTVEPIPEFNADSLKASEVQAAVEKLALSLAVSAVFHDAQNRARTALADRLLVEAADALPAIFDQLRPEFDAAAQGYTNAVAELPDPITSEALVTSDPVVLAAYQTAVAAAKTLRKIDQFIAGTAGLPVHGSFTQQPQLRVLAPSSREHLSALMDAKPRTDVEVKLHPLFLTAARSGIPFRMNTCAEAGALRAELDALPVVRKQPKLLRFA